jgi:hypothetical protein
VVCRLALGLVFIGSAATKCLSAAADGGYTLSTAAFEIVLVQQGQLSRDLAAPTARLLIAVELLLGLLFCQRALLRRLVIPAAGALLTAFTVYLLTRLGADDNCGCFGDVVAMTPGQAIAKNIVMLAVAGTLYRLLPLATPETRAWRMPAALAVGSALAVLLLLPMRPSSVPNENGGENGGENAVSRFARFTVSAVDGTTPSLTAGVQVVAFFSLDCEHCQDTARMLQDIAPELAPIPVSCVFLGEREAVDGFFEIAGGTFPWAIADLADFFDFIGDAPPRVYLLVDGEAREYWDLETFDVNVVLDAALDAAAP